ncbi:MAG: arginyl-tRNA synthetase, partial [Abditibacteriota bacterium]|nr:arginyl-tRNA synthetase [Abditibacteriota bacterium]
MQTIQQQLQNIVDQALQSTLNELGQTDISSVSRDALQVVPCANAQFGDYQWNGALPLAKVLKSNPRALAQSIVTKLEVSDVSAPPEIAGPGFINFRLQREYLQNKTLEALGDARCGIPTAAQPRTVIVDYPSPNVAKPLHVAHIRTMFIGDAIARLLRFVGHNVIGDDHIGDWGTPIGMVIWGWKRMADQDAFEQAPLNEMGRIYKLVKGMTTEKAEDEKLTPQAREMLTAVRAETAKLQSGDAENLAIWNLLRDRSQAELDAMYARLGIRIDERLGESFYNDRLQPVVKDLLDRGLAQESEGAIIIPFEEPAQLT